MYHNSEHWAYCITKMRTHMLYRLLKFMQIWMGSNVSNGSTNRNSQKEDHGHSPNKSSLARHANASLIRLHTHVCSIKTGTLHISALRQTTRYSPNPTIPKAGAQTALATKLRKSSMNDSSCSDIRRRLSYSTTSCPPSVSCYYLR